jgi:hypothetical protein
MMAGPKHDPEKCEAVFRKIMRKNNLKRDDDSFDLITL